MKLFLTLLISLSFQSLYADTIRVSIDIEYDGSVEELAENSAIGNCDLDLCQNVRLGNNLYTFQYNYVILELGYRRWKFHFENGENLKIIIPKLASSDYLIIPDGSAKVKNDFLVERHAFLKRDELEIGFLDPSKKDFIDELEYLRDLYVDKMRSLKLSATFIEDELKFWKYYIMNFELFYDHYKYGNKGLYDLDQQSVSGSKFTLEKESFYTEEYHRIGLAHLTEKFRLAPDFRGMKDTYCQLKNTFFEYAIAHGLKHLIFKYGKKDHYKILNKIGPGRNSNLRALVNQDKLFRNQSEFPKVNVKDFTGKEFSTSEKMFARHTYMFIYDAYNLNLLENFFIWNRFLQENFESGQQVITLGVGSYMVEGQMKKILEENKIAGYHLMLQPHSSLEFAKKNKIVYLPRVVEISNEAKILNADSYDQFFRRNQYDITFSDTKNLFNLGQTGFSTYY